MHAVKTAPSRESQLHLQRTLPSLAHQQRNYPQNPDVSEENVLKLTVAPVFQGLCDSSAKPAGLLTSDNISSESCSLGVFITKGNV